MYVAEWLQLGKGVDWKPKNPQINKGLFCVTSPRNRLIQYVAGQKIRGLYEGMGNTNDKNRNIFTLFEKISNDPEFVVVLANCK